MTLPASFYMPYDDPFLPGVVPTQDVEGLVKQLDYRLSAAQGWLNKYDAYVEGEQPILFMQPALEQELGGRIQPLVINWPDFGVRSYANRLTVEGIRYADQESGDDNLNQIAQANNVDEGSKQAFYDALALGRCYSIVGRGDSKDDAPVISYESPLQVTTVRDPRTRKTTSGWKRWREADLSEWGTLYQPNATRLMTFKDGKWIVVKTDQHNMGVVPVSVYANAPRLLRPDGKSLFHNILKIADAANKMATDMMVSGEFHAMPRRWAFGLEAKDFIGPDGKQKSAWSAIAGRLWANKDKDIKVGQFDEADLTVFHNTIKLLAQITCQLLSLPPHYMAFTGENPASADAIRSAESQLVKNAEEIQIFFGGAHEETMRHALRIQTNRDDPKARSLETVWRDPSTPTVAQKADATVKLVQAHDAQGRSIVPIEQAREDLGYGPIVRQRMAEMDEAAKNDPVIAGLAKALAPQPQQVAPQTALASGSVA